MKDKKDERYVKLGITGCAIALFALISYFVLSNMKGIRDALHGLGVILRPFVYGAVIAYLVVPLCKRLEGLFSKWFKRENSSAARGLAIVLSLLTGLIIVLAVLLLIIPSLAQSIQRLAAALPGQIEALRVELETLFKAHPEWAPWLEKITGNWYKYIDEFLVSGLPAITGSLMGLLSSGASALPQLTGSLINGAAGVVGVLSNLMLGIIVAIYLLAHRRQLAAQARLLLRSALKPSWADWVEKEVHFADRMFHGFFMGKLLESAIVGLLCYIGCLLMGFGTPELIAVIVGVTNIIPFFGPYIGAIPSILILLIINPMNALWFTVFILVLQQVDGNIIGPFILGDHVGLSAFWIMLAILMGGGLFGFVGMLLSVPVFALVYAILRTVLDVQLKNKGLATEVDDFVSAPETFPEEHK